MLASQLVLLDSQRAAAFASGNLAQYAALDAQRERLAAIPATVPSGDLDHTLSALRRRRDQLSGDAPARSLSEAELLDREQATIARRRKFRRREVRTAVRLQAARAQRRAVVNAQGCGAAAARGLVFVTMPNDRVDYLPHL